MSVHERLDSRTKSRHVHGGDDANGETDVVGGALRMGAVEEPERALVVGKGRPHDTAFSAAIGLPASFGVGTTVQCAPSHRSASGAYAADWPTATQFVAVAHDTPFNCENPAEGTATNDQLVPFQR